MEYVLRFSQPKNKLPHKQSDPPIKPAPIINDWEVYEAGSLASLRKRIDPVVKGDGLFVSERKEKIMPDGIFTPAEIEASKLRAEMMKNEDKDLVVTLVCDVNPGVLHVESLKYSQVIGRVQELRNRTKSTVKVLIVYSEETKQTFGWNDMVTYDKPRLPRYNQKYERKRKGYRTPLNEVL